MILAFAARRSLARELRMNACSNLLAKTKDVQRQIAQLNKRAMAEALPVNDDMNLNDDMNMNLNDDSGNGMSQFSASALGAHAHPGFRSLELRKLAADADVEGTRALADELTDRDGGFGGISDDGDAGGW